MSAWDGSAGTKLLLYLWMILKVFHKGEVSPVKGCDVFDTTPVILTYQEFYDFLCKYVEEAIKDMDAEFQTEARKYLLLFKEKYSLK